MNNNIKLKNFVFSNRVYNLLKKNKINTRLKMIRLCNKNQKEWPHNFGRKAFMEVRDILEDIYYGEKYNYKYFSDNYLIN
jgi:DNA-directed RNA polymerase alpha subunit